MDLSFAVFKDPWQICEFWVVNNSHMRKEKHNPLCFYHESPYSDSFSFSVVLTFKNTNFGWAAIFIHKNVLNYGENVLNCVFYSLRTFFYDKLVTIKNASSFLLHIIFIFSEQR